MNRRLALVVAAGLAVRLALIAVGGPPERFEYDDLARSVVSGHGYVYNQLGTPYRSFYAGLGYMAINIAVDRLAPDSPRAMTVVQSLYAGLLALVVFQIARRFGGDNAGVAAAALTLFHPALVYYDTHKLHPLGFDSLLMMTAVWLLLRLRDRPGMSAALAAGAATAFAILQRGSMALFFVAAIVWLAFVLSRPARLVMIYIAAVVAILAPWVVRNYAIHHAPMLESMTPQQFWKGNATYSDGSGYLAGGRNVYESAPASFVREWQQLDETGQFRLFREEGFAEVRRDPARWGRLVLRKFVYFWTAPPNSGQLYPAAYFPVYLIYYGAMLIAAAVGLVSAYRDAERRPDVALILVYFASLSIVHALMFVELRHRFAAEPLMLALAPAGLGAIRARWTSQRVAIAAGLLAFPVFFLLRTGVLNQDGNMMTPKFEHDVPLVGAHVTHDEMLELYVHSRFWYYTHRWWGWPVIFSYQVLSCAAGSVFVYLLLRLANRLAPARTWLFLAGALSGGYMQLFFGDAENYTLTAAVFALYVLAACRYLAREVPLWMPTIALAVGMCFHLQGGFLLPSLLYLFTISRSRTGSYGEAKKCAEAGIALGAAMLLYMHFHGLPLVRLLSSHAARTLRGGMLSFGMPASYFLEQLGLLVLLCPAVLFVGPVAAWRTRGDDELSVFLGIAAVMMLGLQAIWKAALGVADDWNLYSPGAMIIGFYLWRAIAKSAASRPIRLAAIAVAVFGWIRTYAWILEHHRAGTL